MKFYFAHCISDFNTRFEADVLASFSDLDIENPNQPHHQKNYANHGMSYFLEDVLPDCQACIYLELPDGSIGSGVYMEVLNFLVRGDRKAPVFRIVLPYLILHPIGLSRFTTLSWVLNRDETRDVTTRLLRMPNGGRRATGFPISD